jgi:nitrogen fixation/metabolism regulation signal transduction histidine kinase
MVAELRAAELHLAQAELVRRQLVQRAPLGFLLATGLSVVLIGGAAVVLGRRLTRPVDSLVRGMAHYARGELTHRVPVSSRHDELDYLASELNQLGRQLHSQRERLRVSEALAAWREAARALAHDLKNPLTAMRMALGRLSRPGRTPQATDESVSLLQEELDVLIRMSGSFAEFARLPEPERRPVELQPLLEDLGRLYRPECPAGALEVACAGPVTVLGDGDQLRRAVGNLLKNAIEASRSGPGGSADADGGKATWRPVVLSLGPAEAPAVVRIEVRDHGPGIAAAIEGPELMRGLRSAKAGGQRGLGLPIAHKIIHEHGGRLQLRPAEGRGTRAVVELPVMGTGPAAVAKGPAT